MSAASWLIPIVISVLTLILGAAGGGIFMRRGTFKPTFDMLQKAVESSESIMRLKDEQLKLTAAERDTEKQARADAQRARDAEHARCARLEGLLADCTLDRDTWKREKAALEQRIADLEGRLRTLTGQP